MQPYPAMPEPPEFAFDPMHVLEDVSPVRADLPIRAIGDAIAAEFEALIRDRLEELNPDWEDHFPRLSAGLEQADYRRVFSELQDSVIFGQVFDGYPEGLRSCLATLGEFLRVAVAASPEVDMEALFDELEACLPALGLFNDDLQAFAVTVLLLANVGFEGTLTGLVRGSFDADVADRPDQDVWTTGRVSALLDYDHLVLDPEVRTSLHRSPRRQLHQIGVTHHVHGDGLPVGHWQPGVFTLRTVDGNAQVEDEARPPFQPVRLTDRGCIAQFVWGRWYCLGDVHEYSAQLREPREPALPPKVDEAPTAASASQAANGPYEQGDEFDAAIREVVEARERRTPYEGVQAGVQLWIPIIAALMEFDTGFSVRMTPIAQFDAQRGLKRDPAFYELAALQPFVFEVFDESADESHFGFGPGEYYALEVQGAWTTKTLGVVMEAGPKDVAIALMQEQS